MLSIIQNSFNFHSEGRQVGLTLQTLSVIKLGSSKPGIQRADTIERHHVHFGNTKLQFSSGPIGTLQRLKYHEA